MGANKIFPFAQGAVANALSDDAWSVADVLAQGFQQGRAASAKYNKALRQATVMASGLAQFISDLSGQDVTDSLSIQTIRDYLRIAVTISGNAGLFAQDTSGAPNTIAIAPNPPLPALTSFTPVLVRIANTNTGPVIVNYTVDPPGTTPANVISAPLVRRDGTPVQSGDLTQNRFVLMGYDSVAGNWFAIHGLKSDSGAGLAGLTPQQRGQGILSSGFYTILSPTIKFRGVGGGGGGNTTYGGGAGASVEGYLTNLIVGATIQVQVGAPGAGSSSSTGGGNAGATIISSGTQSIPTITANGGLAPVAGSGNAGFGGTATGASIYNGTGNGGSTGIGGIAQPFSPYGNGGSQAMNGIVVNGTTVANQSGAQGIAVFEAVA